MMHTVMTHGQYRPVRLDQYVNHAQAAAYIRNPACIRGNTVIGRNLAIKDAYVFTDVLSRLQLTFPIKW